MRDDREGWQDGRRIDVYSEYGHKGGAAGDRSGACLVNGTQALGQISQA